jgi:hypothetical protein
MGVWTEDPNTGRSQWRDEFPDTPEGRAAAQADTNARSGSSGGGGGGGGGSAGSSASGGGGSNYYGTGTYNTGMEQPYSRSGVRSTETDRTRNIYGRRGDEPLRDWAERAFAQTTRAKGPKSLNPYMDENPLANSPYARWFQQRYNQAIPQNLILQRLLNPGSAAGQDFEPWMEAQMGDAVGNGAGMGFGTGAEGASTNLTGLAKLIEQINRGDLNGLSAEQRTMGSEMLNQPSSVVPYILAQLQGAINPFGMNAASGMISSMLNNEYDDPVGHDQAVQGPFASRVLQRLGLYR